MNLILFFNGIVLVFAATVMLIVAALYWATADIFIMSALVTMFLGGVLALVGQSRLTGFNRRHIFVLTTSSWIMAGFAGAVPLWFWGLSPADAYFESMSGITTTGSTVMSGLDQTAHGILLWRALLQWFGGVGIIVTGIAILPILNVSGMQLFRAESSESGEKELKSAASFATATIWVYVLLTFACVVAYMAGGMSLFDAVTHAMATLSTGGYSTHDASMGYFDSGLIQWSAIVFMVLGSLPFAWFIRAFNRRIFSSEQIAVYIPTLVIIILALTAWRVATSDAAPLDALREVAFSVVSVVTTTGFTVTDYTTWGMFAVAAFFFLTAVGGCTGSTAGGIKIMRWIVSAKAIFNAARSIQYPHGVFAVRHEGRTVEPEVLDGVIAFFTMFFLSVAGMTFALNFMGIDIETALSGSLTALMNVGPGIGDTIGPAGNFASLPDGAKWVLSFGMFLGRLEIMTVLVLMTPAIWVR